MSDATDLTTRFTDDSVARTLELVGERWSMLVIRELFFGVRRFSAMARNLSIPRATLTARLKKLTAAGVIERVELGPGSDRHEYRLTRAGLELYPTTIALMQWGDRHLTGPEGPPIVLRHDECGSIVNPVLRCDVCDKPLDPHSVTPERGPGYESRVEAAPSAG
ncbi:Transcriptional regulator HxlR family [Patulibacter medicamentivorans]|uniref:Transcriptional regulator HxlR family n=1 Tax=Patulibacter medicamentivorans TaxID=1097667 RepID=H0E1X5_9ACTN|nr:helix-turn-helix domain-containing protein [Patulibacter medicamentivorans]EHN12325.1 Transcriptional regulator HxlR family [Patulibacter medicamentivorans]